MTPPHYHEGKGYKKPGNKWSYARTYSRREAIRNAQCGDSRRPGDLAIDSRHQHERLTRIEVKQADEDLGEINGEKMGPGKQP